MNDEYWMRQALNLAARGEGCVEPNPMVGCVLVQDEQCIGRGFHTGYGKPHAEVEALNDARSQSHEPVGATAYVTLEPCSHFGKTPPCAKALIEARVKRVVVAVEDPYLEVAGKGIQLLRDAGIEVTLGVLEEEARSLLAPYLKRVELGLPWIVAKWAMTLDGKIATTSGDSRWISSEPARRWVHQLRGRVDGILVGIGTALADDPELTARHGGPRVPLRLVLDRQLRLPLTSKLARTASDIPVILAAGPEGDPAKKNELKKAGIQIWQPENAQPFGYGRWVRDFLAYLVAEKQVTNLLVEGGASVLGNLLDQDLLDELAVFVAPKVVGGTGRSPLTGEGVSKMAQAINLLQSSHQVLGPDVLIRGRVNRKSKRKA